MSLADDDFGTLIDLPDITADLDRLDRPTESPTSLLTQLDTVSTAAPTDVALSTPAPSFAATTLTPTDQEVTTLIPTNEPAPPSTAPAAPSLASTPSPTLKTLSPTNNNSGGTNNVTEEELVPQKFYFSCPAPAPQTISSRDDNGVPVDIVIDPPVASCHVSYDFELHLTNHSYTVTTAATNMMMNETSVLAYLESLLPGIEDRLGDALANYLMLHTEYTANGTTCGGYIVSGFQRERRMSLQQQQQPQPGRKRLRSEDSSSSAAEELTKIIALTGEEYLIDPLQECTPPDRTCYVVNGRMNATYVGYDESGVQSAVSRLVKREMDKSKSNASNLREYSYNMEYIGPSNNGRGEDVTAQSAAVTPSAIISAEDILNSIPDNVDFHPTPIGIGIIAALAATFVMACYALFSKNDGELKEEVIEEIQVTKHKMKRKKKKKKDDELLVEDHGGSEGNTSSVGYDLESVAIDVKSGGVDDEEAVEIQDTYSFGHTAAVEHMARSEKNGGKSTLSLAEAVKTIPRPEPNRSGSRDIRKKNSPSKIAVSKAAKLASQISADVRMISGCRDSQTSADANITAFELPDPQGRSGGACTAALLQVLYKGHKASVTNSWAEVLREMRENLASKGYDQIPQLTCSRIIDVNDPTDIVPKHPTGTKRALLIGINYTSQSGALSGCHNDIKHIAQYLQKVHGFCKQNMIILLDNGKCPEPNYANIMIALERVARDSQPGDTVWFHYSGHGGRLPDNSNEEQDGYDETIIPLDFQRSGQIRDDDLLKKFVLPMKKGVMVTCVMDCCHSGTVLDLPYQFLADGNYRNMGANNKFSRDGSKINTRSPSSSAAILQDLEASSRTNPTSRGSPRKADPFAIPKLPPVPETDLPPPIHDTPSHRSKVARMISPTSVNEVNHFRENNSVVLLMNSEGEEQWEV